MTRVIFAAALAATFALLTACGDTGTNTASNTSNAPANKPSSKSADYPPLPTAVADFEFEMIDGTKSKIADRKGKVVMVNLWATWCGPCRAEMPHLVELQNLYGPKGFTVLGLDIGGNDGKPESVEDIQRFATGMKLNYELARIPSELNSKFNKISNFNAIPQSYLIDREGHIRGVFLGGGRDVITKMKQTTASLMAE
jgi:thiol-disulfide isomerase/thioredoxin